MWIAGRRGCGAFEYLELAATTPALRVRIEEATRRDVLVKRDRPLDLHMRPVCKTE